MGNRRNFNETFSVAVSCQGLLCSYGYSNFGVDEVAVEKHEKGNPRNAYDLLGVLR